MPEPISSNSSISDTDENSARPLRKRRLRNRFTPPAATENGLGDSNAQQALELAEMGERLCALTHYPQAIGLFVKGLALLGHTLSPNDNGLLTPRPVSDSITALASAMFSQLGNAYFYARDYDNALLCHQRDLTLTRNDIAGEGKAWGNLGNSYKMLNQFDEAIHCCQKHYEIAISLHDRLSQSRALYNLGNMYHGKAKWLEGAKRSQKQQSNSHSNGTSLSSSSSTTELYGHPEFKRDPAICTALQKALEYYEESLWQAKALEEGSSGLGRIYGSLGNVHYLLGNFERAIHYHKQRLKMAEEIEDSYAQRRAHTNLANAHVFLGEFQDAIDHYTRALRLALESGDAKGEAQTYYSLGNTYALMCDHDRAVEMHLAHLEICGGLGDMASSLKSFWSLSHVYLQMGNLDFAKKYATSHYELALKVSDVKARNNAMQNLDQINKYFNNSKIFTPNFSLLSNKLNFKISAKADDIMNPPNLPAREMADINPRKKKESSFFSSACINWPFFRHFRLLRRRSLGQGGGVSQLRSAVSPILHNPDHARSRPQNGYDPHDDDEGGFHDPEANTTEHARGRISPLLLTNVVKQFRHPSPLLPSASTRFAPHRPRQSSPHHVIRGGGLISNSDSIPGLSGIYLNNSSTINNNDVSAILPFHKRKSMEQMEQIILSPLSLTTGTIHCLMGEEAINRFNASSSTKIEGYSSYVSNSNNLYNNNNNIMPKGPDKIACRPENIKISRKMTVEQSDDLYDLVTSFQSHRMDDQRSEISLLTLPKSGRGDLSSISSTAKKEMSPKKVSHKNKNSSTTILHPNFSLTKRFSLKKRESLSTNPGPAKNERKKSKNHTTNHHKNNVTQSQTLNTEIPTSHLPGESVKDGQKSSTIIKKGPEEEDFFDMVFRCQGARIDDQRVEGPNVTRPQLGEDEIIDLVGKMQSGRMDGQRSFITHPAARQR